MKVTELMGHIERELIDLQDGRVYEYNTYNDMSLRQQTDFDSLLPAPNTLYEDNDNLNKLVSYTLYKSGLTLDDIKEHVSYNDKVAVVNGFLDYLEVMSQKMKQIVEELEKETQTGQE